MMQGEKQQTIAATPATLIEAAQSFFINYRNAVYQGGYNKKNQSREGLGIIYISDSHNFMVCSNFQHNRINGAALFFNDHAKYSYGDWQDDVPHGLNIFRIGQALFIAEYEQGIIPHDAKIFLLLEKYNIGVILRLRNEIQQVLEVLQKGEIYCSQHLRQMVKKCDFSSNQLANQSLIRFVSSRLLPQGGNRRVQPRIRLVNNCYYRLGFDKGLALVFDDQYRRLSVGMHTKSTLTSVGAKFNLGDLSGIVEEGIFDESDRSVFSFNRENRPLNKVGRLYSRHHLTQINFKNQFFVDPSQPYFLYFQKLLKSHIIRTFLSGFLSRKSYDTTAQKPKVKQLQPRYGQISTHKQSKHKDCEHDDSLENSKQHDLLVQLIRNESKKQFEKLPQRNRLQIIKKELFDSIKVKKIISLQKQKIDEEMQEQERNRKKSRIVKMDRVSGRSRRQQFPRNQEIKIDDQQIAGYEELIEQRSNKMQQTKQNKEPRNIIKTPERIVTKSRSKRKIFEETKNIKRDYSRQISPSPFKARMRGRIFPQKSTEKANQRERSSSLSLKSNQIKQSLAGRGSNLEEKQQVQASRQKLKSKKSHSSFSRSDKSSEKNSIPEQYNSPYQQIGNSQERSEMTILTPVPVVNDLQTEYIEYQREGEKKVGQLKKWERGGQKNNFQDTGTFKKGNQVYRHTLSKGSYGNYVYEPINTFRAGNMPYMNSTLRQILRDRSVSPIRQAQKYPIRGAAQQIELYSDSNKKIIGESSPWKRQKMQSYLVQVFEPITKNETFNANKKRDKKYDYLHS